MIRGLVLGAIAFAAAFTLERQFGGIGKDLIRYDRLNEMSGEPPFLRKVAERAIGAVGRYAVAQQGKAGDVVQGVLQSLLGDVFRYVRIRGM